MDDPYSFINRDKVISTSFKNIQDLSHTLELVLYSETDDDLIKIIKRKPIYGEPHIQVSLPEFFSTDDGYKYKDLNLELQRIEWLLLKIKIRLEFLSMKDGYSGFKERSIRSYVSATENFFTTTCR